MKFEWPKFSRCCCCLPLRKGVITFGYVNIIFSLWMLAVFSILLNTDRDHAFLLYHGIVSRYLVPEIGLVLYILEVIFNALLLHGAHTNKPKYIKAFFYFGLSTVVACFLIELLELFSRPSSLDIETMGFGFAGICIQVYLMSLSWSLLLKMEESSSNCYDNPLHQIIVDDAKTETETNANFK